MSKFSAQLLRTKLLYFPPQGGELGKVFPAFEHRGLVSLMLQLFDFFSHPGGCRFWFEYLCHKIIFGCWFQRIAASKICWGVIFSFGSGFDFGLARSFAAHDAILCFQFINR